MDDGNGGNKFKRSLFIMDSMNDDELDGKVGRDRVDIGKSESRILRVARGSGTHPDEVRALLKLHKHFEKVMGKMGKGMKVDAQMAKQMQVRPACRNPALAKQHVDRMDPKVVESLGGRQKVLEMIKSGKAGPGGGGGGMDQQG
ncbi:unnamed protein product, partial [Discosporangium mesarthrocarpum]